MKTRKGGNRGAEGYAEVLFETGTGPEAVRETARLLEETPELLEALTSPVAAEREKERVIDRVFPEEIRNFLKLLCRYGKAGLLTHIFEEYEAYSDRAGRVVRAELFCIDPPEKEQLEGIQAFLCRKYGARQAKIEIRRDPDILGGFILRSGNDEYDWSVKGRLDRLKEKLTRR